MADVSIALTVQDNMSAALVKIRSAVTPARADIQELQTELDTFNRTKVSLQVDLERAKRELAEAKKTFRETADEANATRLTQAQEEYNTLADQLKEVSAASKQTVRDMEEVSGAVSRADNRAGRSGSGAMSVTQTLGALGAGQQAAQLLSAVGGTVLSSAFGSEAGSLLSGALSSTVSGAVAGAALGGIPGALIGGAAGAVSGVASGATANFEKRDEYFKSYYTGIIDDLATERAETIAAGSEISATREGDLRALEALLGGSSEAMNFQRQAIKIGRTPPFSYDTAMSLSREMLGLGLSADETLERIKSLSNAAAALDLSETNVTSIVSYLEAAQLAGKLESRVVKSLSKLGINVYDALADEFGISTDQVAGQLGELDVDRGISAIYKYMETNFAGAAEGLANTYSGASGRLESYQSDISARYGEGYNRERTSGITAEVDALSGTLGVAMRQQGEVEGALAAYRENLQEQYTREALSALYYGKDTTLEGLDNEELQTMRKEYQDWAEQYEAGSMEAGLKMENLKDQAESLAQAAYDSSEWAKKELTAQEELTEATRSLSAAFDGWAAQYALQLERSKGQAAVPYSVEGGAAGGNAASGYLLGNGGAGVNSSPYAAAAQAAGRAVGERRVPYDGFLAYLHEGERVLTAQEARQTPETGGDTFNLYLGGVTVREEADIQRIAQALGDEIARRRQAALG